MSRHRSTVPHARVVTGHVHRCEACGVDVPHDEWRSHYHLQSHMRAVDHYRGIGHWYEGEVLHGAKGHPDECGAPD